MEAEVVELSVDTHVKVGIVRSHPNIKSVTAMLRTQTDLPAVYLYCTSVQAAAKTGITRLAAGKSKCSTDTIAAVKNRGSAGPTAINWCFTTYKCEGKRNQRSSQLSATKQCDIQCSSKSEETQLERVALVADNYGYELVNNTSTSSSERDKC